MNLILDIVFHQVINYQILTQFQQYQIYWLFNCLHLHHILAFSTYKLYCSKICGYKDSAYTKVNNNISMQQDSIELEEYVTGKRRYSSKQYASDKCSIIIPLTKKRISVTKYIREQLNSVVRESKYNKKQYREVHKQKS